MKRILKRLLKFVGIFTAVVCMVCGVILTGYSVMGAVMYRTAVEQRPVEAAAREIMSRENFVPTEELPEFYVRAVISVEDRDFERHFVIDISAIFRALIHDIMTISAEQGGSTITQQLAKNLYFTGEKRPERKFAEILTAFELESRLSKSEIFALYVNTIYFGNGYYGIYDAAEGYFGKTPQELDEYECAMLAGIPQAPSVYCDISAAPAQRRLKEVLSGMAECGVIDGEKAEAIASAAAGE